MNVDLIPDDGLEAPDEPFALATCDLCGESFDARDVDRHYEEVHEPTESWLFEPPDAPAMYVVVPAGGLAWALFRREGDDWGDPVVGRRIT